MKREIKFRAWQKNHKKMCIVPQIQWDNQQIKYVTFDNGIDCAPRFNTYGFKDWSLDCLELMQFTGLKDNNGVEIYEGDICVVNDGFVGKKRLVRYIDEKAAFMFEVLEDVESVDFRKLKGELRFISKYDYQTSDKIEVIGNIHENPELL